MRSVLLFAATLLALYLSWLALLYVGQRGMMFPGVRLFPADTVRVLPQGVERMAITAGFGQVRAFLLPADNSTPTPAPALLYFHGNAELASQNIPLLQPLTTLGMHVLLVEYPGYAGSDGTPSRTSLAEAAQAAHAWLVAQHHVDGARIVGMGRSIGSGPVLELARERPLAAVVLLSPFATLEPFAHRMGAPGWLIRDRFDNLAAVRSYDGPVLLFHGRRDSIIPFAHSQALERAGSGLRPQRLRLLRRGFRAHAGRLPARRERAARGGVALPGEFVTARGAVCGHASSSPAARQA